MIQQLVYSNSPFKLVDLSHCKRTSQSQSQHTFPNSNLHRRHTYVARTLTTSGTRRPSCGINTSRRERVLSGSYGRIHGSLLLWSRRNSRRRTGHIRIVWRKCSDQLRASGLSRRRWKGRSLGRKRDLGESEAIITIHSGGKIYVARFNQGTSIPIWGDAAKTMSGNTTSAPNSYSRMCTPDVRFCKTLAASPVPFQPVCAIFGHRGPTFQQEHLNLT